MTLFFDEEDAIKKLRERGYRVVKEEYGSSKKVSTVRDLVDYFYSRRRFYNQDRKCPHSIDYSEDAKSISSFVKSREKLGLGRKQAIAEAAELIDTLFKFEKHLGLREPITKAKILAVRPIMDRVCSYLNGEVDEVNETDTILEVDHWNEYYNKYYANQDFIRAADERAKILEKMNERKDGK